MAAIQVRNVTVEENPSRFTDEFDFNIRFDCTEEISDDLNWKVLYVGSSSNEKCDQLLEDVLVGPVVLGSNEFQLNCPAPDASRIPPDDLLGVTVLLLVCEYKEQEFIRVGWYVNNDIKDGHDDMFVTNPAKMDVNNITRNILINQPRVTTKTIDWR
eukprot:TRINITY_DN1860_c0_g1_i1.p1 TRINITY_DN1860_c0_g1~~TRINITY_DN1860_c0_g1_i1.p1  ORF type:complete len:173 (+),score=27.70 TRINITY_DN1860_c0_g1_i1:49-519(+)